MAVVLFTTSYQSENQAVMAAGGACTALAITIRMLLLWRQSEWIEHRTGLWVSGIILSSLLLAIPCGLFLSHTILKHGYSDWDSSVILLWTTGISIGAIVTYTPFFPLLAAHILVILPPALLTALSQGGQRSYTYGLANLLLTFFILAQGRRLYVSYWERAIDLHREAERRREVELARVQADAASRAKGEFLANMSHEIRTPMHGILGMADLALASANDPIQVEQLQTLRGSAVNLLRILNDVLDLSKVEAGKLELNLEPCSAAQLVDECRLTFAAQAATKGLQLTTKIRSPIDEYVMIDGPRLRQVLLNLLGNAVKFTATGKVEIGLKRTALADGKTVRLGFGVRDTGPGIPLARQEQIFDAFSQGDSGIFSQFGGTGLGLAISNRLVRLMDSSIELESKPGEGSCFSFVLDAPLTAPPPKPAVAAVTAGSASSPRQTGRPCGSGRRGMRILLAEDNPVNQKVALAQLAILGHNVKVAQNGQEAVNLTLQASYDLILMDSQMPVMDGLAATVEIREIHRKLGRARVPVVALTASAMPGDRERLLAAGMDGYLAKPFDLDALDRTIQEALSAAP